MPRFGLFLFRGHDLERGGLKLARSRPPTILEGQALYTKFAWPRVCVAEEDQEPKFVNQDNLDKCEKE